MEEIFEGRKFDPVKNDIDNFYTEAEITISEAYQLIQKSETFKYLPEDYKKIVFKEILRAILPSDYKKIVKD